MRVIELLARMHEPRCISAEVVVRGAAVLSKEQILAAFARAEHQYCFGYQLLMAKFLRDNKARDFIREYVSAWAEQFELSDLAAQALHYVVDMVTDIPLPAQQKRIRSLHNRYMRSQFAFTRAIDQANNLAASQGEPLNSKEARALRVSKINEVRRSTCCPRCRGTGEIGRVQKCACPECEGAGRLRATVAHLVKSLNVSEDVFKRELNAVTVQFEQHCYAEMSNAEQAMKERLRAEMDESVT